MFGRENKLVRETIALLSNPQNWNSNGGYRKGTFCIVTAATEFSTGDDNTFLNLQSQIRKQIFKKYGITRGALNVLNAVVPSVIDFNDHPKTTHADVMDILLAVEKNTKPFWRKQLETSDGVR